MPTVVKWPAEEPLTEEFLGNLKKILDSGDIIVYPTNTLYGMGASIFSDAGINKVNELKQRPEKMPYLIMANESQIREICAIPEIASRFFERQDLLVTAILPAKNSAPISIVHEGTVAMRLPCSELTRSLVEKVGPITSTSANVHGDFAANTAMESLSQFGEKIPVYIDSGTLPGTPSTLVDFTGEKPKVIREGAISPDEVQNAYG